MIRPIGVLLGVMATCAVVMGAAGYFFGRSHPHFVAARELPPAKQAVFLADAAAHLTSYGVGFVGGLVLIGWTIFARWREIMKRLEIN